MIGWLIIAVTGAALALFGRAYLRYERRWKGARLTGDPLEDYYRTLAERRPRTDKGRPRYLQGEDDDVEPEEVNT